MTIKDIIPELTKPSDALLKHAKENPEIYNAEMIWQLGFLAGVIAFHNNIDKLKENK